MNVFVLCTGRSGSTTFAKACEHFTNYASGHETRTRIIGPEERFAYPENHIEADNHLSMQLGHLQRRYGDAAFYVHLTRDRERVAASFERLIDSPYSNIRAFAAGVLLQPWLEPADVPAACLDYVDTVNANIEAFLAGKPLALRMDIDEPQPAFDQFMKRIAAEGDLEAARCAITERHNRKSNAYYTGRRHRIKRAILRTAERVLSRV